MRKHSSLPLFLLVAAACAPVPPTVTVTPRASAAAPITTADLRARLEIFAHDSMMGREAGTIYNDKGTDYLAAEAARIGLQPAGENGTYFQRMPLMRRVFAPGTQLQIGARAFTIWQDFLPRDQGPGMRSITGVPVVYGGAWTGGANALIASADAAGKVVVISVPRGWQANRIALTNSYVDAAGVLVVSLDSIPADTRALLSEPAVGFSPGEETSALPAFIYTTGAMGAALFDRPLNQLAVGATGRPITGQLQVRDEPAPGMRNVIGLIPGTDPALRGQYVVFGAHNDHVGFNRAPVDHDSLRAYLAVVRPQGADDPARPATASEMVRIRAILDSLRAIRAPRLDSIFNGADDDGSGSVALLAIAEAFMRPGARPRRSLLFIWHTAEEAGLLGAAHFTENPTVPRDSIIAMINVDMISRGRATDTPGGGPGYLQAIGSRRLSSELGRVVDEVAATMTPAINIDYQFDRQGHPQQYYCRSDHYMYARYQIPVAFFTTGGHRDYHQQTDEIQYADFDKLALVSRFVHRIGERLANADRRVVVDRRGPGPGERCVQ